MHLYIGYKRYSSWSLRPWLAMKVKDISFGETVLPFAHDDSLRAFAKTHNVPATVPALEHNGRIVWDSLAILDYLSDIYPEKRLWPQDLALRGLARSASAEMHCSFVSLRTEHPMNCHRVHPMIPNQSVTKELQRLAAIWDHFDQIDKPEGNFLCGEFSIVDAMFAPVAWRTKGYQLEVSEAYDRWSCEILGLAEMSDWVRQGSVETWRVEETEQIGILN